LTATLEQLPARSAAAETRPAIAFLVNGGPDSAMGIRAGSFASRLADHFEISLIHRRGGKLAATRQMFCEIIRRRPQLCYVFDMAASGILAAGLYRQATGTPFIVDTGDDIVALGRALGRSGLSLMATQWLERYSLRRAACVVVRGSKHLEKLSVRGIRAEFVPDGVDVEQFAPPSHLPPRDLDQPLTVGLIGSSIWIPTRTCYGWELVELIRLLSDRLDRRVRGVMVGDGSGIEHLKRRSAELGISDRMSFLGRVSYDQLPALLHTFDICLSTQTNDEIGQVRTTGKLPLYLAAGRFVLASRVGEAARVLPPEMLVSAEGNMATEYPQRLADRIVALLHELRPHRLQHRCIELADKNFAYDRLAQRLQNLVHRHLPAAMHRKAEC
jgi:glycosyltransferase involved in cell wall biosynthesis